MEEITEKRIYYINSGNQLSSLISYFTVPIEIPNGYDRITVLGAQIPISFYLVQQGYNTFTLTENGTSVVISITIGSYNANSFSLALVSLLNANSPNGYTYTITYPINYTENNTGKYTFTCSNTSSVISFTFPLKSQICELFGFHEGETATFSSGVLVSENCLNFIPETSLFLHSNLCDNGDNDILQEIYSSNNIPFSTISFQNNDPIAYSKRLTSSNIKNAYFNLTNEFGTPIYFQGLDMLITLLIYKSSNYHRDLSVFLQSQKVMNEKLLASLEVLNESVKNIKFQPYTSDTQPFDWLDTPSGYQGNSAGYTGSTQINLNQETDQL